MGTGNIFLNKDNSCAYRVRSKKYLAAIIDHFDKYPLITQKRADYLLFKQAGARARSARPAWALRRRADAFELIKYKKHLTIEGLHSLVKIKSYPRSARVASALARARSMNKGLSEELKKAGGEIGSPPLPSARSARFAFPDIVPIDRPLIEEPKIIDPNWLAGFVDGEACFFFNISKSKTHKTGFQVLLRFSLGQDLRDCLLINSLVQYFACGIYSESFTQGPMSIFTVTKFKDIEEKLIPFLDKYPIQGSKSQYFSDFRRVVKLMQNKAHLTSEGLEQIRLIKFSLNRGRENSERATRACARSKNIYICIYIYIYIFLGSCGERAQRALRCLWGPRGPIGKARGARLASCFNQKTSLSPLTQKITYVKISSCYG